MKRKRFKAVIDDSGMGRPVWQVWSFANKMVDHCYAEFYGKGALKYARAHARTLALYTSVMKNEGTHEK